MRGPSRQYQQRVAALAFVKPTRDRLEGWVTASANVLGRARLGRLHAIGVKREAMELLTLVERHRAALVDRLSAEPTEISQHGRAQDVLRALDAVTNMLGDAVDLADQL